MTQESSKVENLSKVALLVEAGSTQDAMDLTPGKCHVEFIMGVAAEGLTPFECQILGKREGEAVTLALTQAVLAETFGHIDVPVLRQIDADSFFLKATVDRVSKPEDREIVKAMACASGCSSDCGCGCDGH